MALYAVIASGNSQYQVELGDVVELEKIAVTGKTVTFEEVLLLVDGDKIEIGQPTLKGVTVEAQVLEESVKGKKIRIFRYKAKSRFRKTTGHRQSHTVVKITKIGSHKLASPVKSPSKSVTPASSTKLPPEKKTTAKKSTPAKKVASTSKAAK